MARAHWEHGEVDRLSIDLSGAPSRIQRQVPKVLEVAANKVKRSLKDDAKGHGHLPGLDRAVSYDKLDPFRYEIGFDKVRQGNLANIAVYGSVNNAPVMASPADHLRLEVPHILRNLSSTAEGAVLGGDHER